MCHEIWYLRSRDTVPHVTGHVTVLGGVTLLQRCGLGGGVTAVAGRPRAAAAAVAAAVATRGEEGRYELSQPSVVATCCCCC